MQLLLDNRRALGVQMTQAARELAEELLGSPDLTQAALDPVVAKMVLVSGGAAVD